MLQRRSLERIITDNGGQFVSAAFQELMTIPGINHVRTSVGHPQTNGKIERFHRTLAEGWAFSRHYNSESARRAALPAWLAK